MNKKVYTTLEFNKIRERLSGLCVSPMAKELALELEPSADINEININQNETTEAVSMILKKGSVPLGGLRDLREVLRRAEAGGILSLRELLNTADFLNTCQSMKSYGESENKKDNFDILKPYFDEVVLINDLEADISRKIISEAEISDLASKELFSIRQSIRSANDRIRESLNNIIHSASSRTMLQNPVITIRNDRYCVPVKQEYVSSFKGILHDRSSTGATVFMEPASVVEANNRIAELKIKEKEEIQKILQRLSEAVAENSGIIRADSELLVHLDFVFAKGELSLAMEGSKPFFNKEGYINLKRARHPLIAREKVVPTNIWLGKDFTTLLITGPNTGGKTVALKTIGIFSLMGQAGLHIPAFDGSELGVFEEIFADIGDEQSIEQSLSTFSSHMSNIVSILDNVTPESLVLIDELGSGTDPTEGSALAVSIIKYLHGMKVRTAVTTHYSELKLFALTEEGVENASCEFDINTLSPTYRLMIGVPGKSNAFAISKKLGLKDFIIEGAKEILSREDIKVEDAILELESGRKTIEIERERAEAFRKEAERYRAEIKEQNEKLKERKEKIILSANEEARRIISDAKDESDKIIKEMRRLSKEAGSTEKLEQKRKALKENLNKSEEKLSKLNRKNKPKRERPKKLNIGDRVFIDDLGTTGSVVTKPEQNGDVFVQAGIMKIKTNIKRLSLTEEKPADYSSSKGIYSAKVRMDNAKSVSTEVDLRGLNVYEGIDKLDKYIDSAILAGISPVNIIHGKGTGVMRSAVHDFLKSHSSVKSYRLGEYGEGDSGITVVVLK
ncbi:MAG: endonuclease MutS2 [Clostridiales bacterium]|nr:endonuclease MutS2 [Clostridiales bacterium]